jgi:hypothetical protein
MITPRWRGLEVSLLALDERTGSAWVIEIGSGFAHTVAVEDLTWEQSSKASP